MKLSQLHEQHFAVWADHPGGLGGTDKKDKKKNRHPGVPEHWQDSFEKKTKDKKEMDKSGKYEASNKK